MVPPACIWLVCLALPHQAAAERTRAVEIGSCDANGSGTVTFNRDVMPIVQTHCQTCHRPGEAAPFSLLTYRQAAKWASDIQLVTEKRIMPPWKAVPGFGEFRNERRLTDSEIATIAAWVEDGCPEGDRADLPPPREFPSGGWQLGEPDLVLSMSEEYEIYASGRDIYRHFVIPTGLTEDRWVTATEFRSGNPRVAHHAIFFTDTTGRARRMDADDPQPGFGRRLGFMPREHIGFWAVGTEPAPLPDGVGMRLPKGADVVLQVHYHPSGKPERDRSSLGIYFAKKPVEKEFFFLPVIGWRFQWPAGDDHIPATGRLVLPADIHAISVFPHMHLLGKEFKMTATLPDESTTPLVYIREWDFNWQQFYTYQSPLALPKGTRIEVEVEIPEVEAHRLETQKGLISASLQRLCELAAASASE